LLFFFLASSAADKDSLRFFLACFFFLDFLSSGSLSELELLEDEVDEPDVEPDVVEPESELELDELLDGLRLFLFPAANTTQTTHRLK